MQSQQGMAAATRNGPIQSSLDQSLTEGIMDRNDEGGYILEENHSEYSREKELAHQLNRFRFKNQKIIQKLLNLIGGGEGEGAQYQTSIVLPDMNREIKFQNEEMVKKLRNYIHEIDIVNQILSDFTFNSKQNEEFVHLYKSQIIQNKMLFDQYSDKMRQKLQGSAHYSYFLKDITLKNYDELIILLLIEEFIILNSQFRADETLTLDFSHAPQHLGLIDNLYNKLFICISDKNDKAQGQDGIEQNNQNKQKSIYDPNALYDVFILLIYDDNINTNQELNTPLMKNTNFKNGFLSQTAMQQQNQQNQPLTNTQRTDRFDQSLYPEKYMRLIKRSTQIPKASVLALVDLMDSNADRRVTIEDIKAFSHKKFIYFKENIYQEIFDDVIKLRRTTFSEQKNLPLTVDEIWAAVQMHYKLGPGHEWVENPRPYRKYWIQLLQAAGEKLPKQHDLPHLKIQPIKDQHQMTIQKNKSMMSKSQSCVNINQQFMLPIDIKNVPKKQYLKPFRAEAGIVVNNTENIQEVVQDYREQMSHIKEQEPFEKVVNLKFKHPESGEFQSIKFETKNYFNEADRLSKNPHLYKTHSKNPIYSFVPENFNFQISTQNQPQAQTQGQEFFQNERKGKQSIRFSKALSSNMGFIPNYDQDSISQLKEIDDMEEYDAESLMKTQSIRLSTLRVPSRNPQQGSTQYHKSSLPHLGTANTKKGNYPYDVFNPQFYSRKHSMKKVVTPLEKNLEERNNFITTFKVENCHTLKQKLSQQEPITDIYNPVSQVQFREQHTPEKKESYITRFKCDPLANPYGMSEHDNRPKEALEREQKDKKRKQEEEQKKIDEFMGKVQQDKLWVKYFKLADMDHNFVDQQRPVLLQKGSYTDPSTILYNLLRGDSDYKLPFKLAHRTLRAGDKNLFLGQVQDSKF